MQQLAPLVRCSEIREHIANRGVRPIWPLYLAQIATLQHFWETATTVWASRIGLAPSKRDKLLATIGRAFELMDGWRTERCAYVKARRNEIDSAISFIRTHALDREVSSLALAPVARNVASTLRACLNIAARSYSDDQFATVVAQSVYDLAFARTLFPLDVSNLSAYMPAGLTVHAAGGDLDNYHLLLESGVRALGLEEALATANEEAARIWREFDRPAPFRLNDSLWTRDGGQWSADLYYAHAKSFHQR